MGRMMDVDGSLCFNAVVLGGSIAAVIRAYELASHSRKVLLAHTGTCLPCELTDAGDYRAITSGSRWASLLFPSEVYMEDGSLHPNRLKVRTESLLEQAGVSILYAVHAVNFDMHTVTLAHKGGTLVVNADEVYDLRGTPYITRDSFILHFMKDKQHGTVLFGTCNTGNDSASRYAVYKEALDHLPKGATPARSGMRATQKRSISIDEATEYGLSAQCVREKTEKTEKTNTYDVIIVGGGTSGASAALFSGRQGLKTLLLEMNAELGGTSTIGGVNTYWFGLRTGAAHIIDSAVANCRAEYGLPAKPGLWNDDDGFYPDVKAHVLLGLCLEAGVDVRFDSLVYAAETDKNRLKNIRWTSGGVSYTSSAKFIIDCTGDGDVCVLAGADYTYGNETDGMTYWASLAHYPTPDTYRNNFSTMVDVGDVWDYTRFIIAGRRLGDNMYDHGNYVAVRESRHIRGLETATFSGFVSMRNVKDPLYTCFSNYDPKGRLTAEECYFGMIPPNQLYIIPKGACIPADKTGNVIEGLLVGGKAISCTHDAFPGIRMQSDLERQGLALAALAGCAIESGVSAADATNISARISALGGDCAVPEPVSYEPLSKVIDGLTGEEPWEWLDTTVTDCRTNVEPVIRVMTADRAEAVRLLKNRFTQADSGMLRLCIARLLLFHRCPVGVQTVLDEINRQLSEVRYLPQRTGSLNYGQMLPDHGLMPETVYLINSLAYAPETDIIPLMTDVLSRLEHMERDWHNLRAGVYCWCESFAFTASRRKDKAMIPLIQRLLMLPEFAEESDDALLNERLHMLRITLLDALRVLGCPDGARGLEQYLSDRRAPLRHAAAMLLGY